MTPSDLLACLLVGCGVSSGGKDPAHSAIDSGTSDSTTPTDPTDSADTGDTGDSPVDTGDSEDSQPTETGDPEPRPDSDTSTYDVETEAAAKLLGAESRSTCGDTIPVGAAGDVDGDGSPDVVLGFICDSRGGTSNSGVAFVVSMPVRGTVPLDEATAIIVGGGGDEVGDDVDGAGDVNGDGYHDVIVGAPLENSWGVFFGPLSGSIDYAAADATLYPDTMTGGHDCAYEVYGVTDVAGAGDVNGDGLDDVLVAAGTCHDAYLLHGPFEGDVDLATQAAFRLSGDAATESNIEWTVVTIGDTDGDGLADVYLHGGDNDDDDVALLFVDSPTGEVSADDADGVITRTEDGTAFPGRPGDLDGDGYADLAATAFDAGDYAGATAIFSGPLIGRRDVAEADATLEGAAEEQLSGYAVDALGDLDGDGRGELAIGAPTLARNAEGRVFVVYGPVAGTVSLVDAEFEAEADSHDNMGTDLAGIGDVDGDGIPDLLVSGAGDDEAALLAGAAWLIPGADMLR